MNKFRRGVDKTNEKNQICTVNQQAPKKYKEKQKNNQN
jgi:hypothetical protein